MRVAVILDKLPGVSETFLIQHVNGLIDAGVNVTVFARATPPPPKTHPQMGTHGLPDRIHYLPFQDRGVLQLAMLPRTIRAVGSGPGAIIACLNPLASGAGVFRLRAVHGLPIVEKFSFDILHCHYAAVGWAFLPYRTIFGVPFVTSFHGDHPGSFPKGRERLLRGLFRRGDAFVANSGFTRAELLRMRCPDSKIHVIPAIAGEHTPRRTPRHTVSTTVHIVTVARLDFSKGIHVALRAVAELRTRNVAVHYTIAGNGPYAAKLKSLAAELCIAGHVTFLGWQAQNEVTALYDDADIVVLPSIGVAGGMSETQGLTLQEAQLRGIPVVGTDIGGIPESLDYGRAGLLFRKDDPSALANAILHLIANPDLATALTTYAASYVRSKYTSAAVIPRLIQMYESMLGGKAGRTSDFPRPFA